MSFTLQGVMRDGRDAFKEAGDSKFFVRNFIIVPKPEGFVSSSFGYIYLIQRFFTN